MEQRSAVSFVDQLIQHACASAASDIHLEPHPETVRIRLRIDGQLYDHMIIKASFLDELVMRIKVIAHINIAERRIPQDGKFSVSYKSHLIDVRVSTFPTLWGEKIVLRILNRQQHALALENLGLSSTLHNQFKKLLKRSHGLLLVTGPTGSGKTTTLYAALSYLNAPEKHIVTLEDPVEYDLPGITQGYINTDTGFTFERGIRSLLRHDPDVMMIGEIRDRQTAKIVLEAALTGHLVLSTLHTQDALSAITRLIDIGIEPCMIGASLLGVMAQRLVRTICTHCAQNKELTAHEQEIINPYLADAIVSNRVGMGCAQCKFTGFKGRIGIFQLVEITSTIKERMLGADRASLYAKNDMVSITLGHDAAAKVAQGAIPFTEFAHVLA
jgi:type IV pilus assembly protein PilB